MAAKKVTALVLSVENWGVIELRVVIFSPDKAPSHRQEHLLSSPWLGYAYDKFAVCPLDRILGKIMEWTAPAFEEICLNCEINSYASAKL
jgi:coenzyme PQQ precursor peptide PqqA